MDLGLVPELSNEYHIKQGHIASAIAIVASW